MDNENLIQDNKILLTGKSDNMSKTMYNKVLGKIYKKLTYRFLFEVSVLIIVFSWSLSYFLNKNTKYLVSSCEQCDGTCNTINTLKSQITQSTIYLNVLLDSQKGTNYSNLILSGSLQTCQLPNPKDFETTVSSKQISFELQSTNNPIENKIDYDNNTIIIDSYSCFKLMCLSDSTAGYSSYNGNINIPQYNTINSEMARETKLFGQLTTLSKTVIASCYISIDGTLINFFSSSNSFSQSEILECLLYSNEFLSIANSLSYMLSVLSLIKFIHYFRTEFINK